MSKISIINVTDLYFPPQDPGDNFDIVTAYLLPEIELKAIILDVTEKYRHQRYYLDHDVHTKREAGIIAIHQMNYITDRNVPYGVSPYSKMKRKDDPMSDVPNYQQTGIELLLQTLQDADEPIEILIFSSVKTVAAAFNRNKNLFYDKVKRIHISAGASSSDFLEWNVELDPLAMARLMESDLPIVIYPCATDKGPFDCGQYNSFWKLLNLNFIREMTPKLKRYLGFAFLSIDDGLQARYDFLRAMDEDFSEDEMRKVYALTHNVWETAVWIEVAKRKIIHREGSYKIIPEQEVLNSDEVIVTRLLPCKIKVNDTGLFGFELTDQATNFNIFFRENPAAYERALREALPLLYKSFTV